MANHGSLLRVSLIAGLAAASLAACPAAGSAARPEKETVVARGTGSPASGTRGTGAKRSAFLAATVHALVRWAKTTQGDQLDWMKDTNSGSFVFRQSLETRLPGGFRVASDSWVKNEKLVHSIQRLKIPRGRVSGRLPLLLIVVNGTLVSPSVELLDPREVQRALEDSGYSLSSTSSGGNVNVTISRPKRRPRR